MHTQLILESLASIDSPNTAMLTIVLIVMAMITMINKGAVER